MKSLLSKVVGKVKMRHHFFQHAPIEWEVEYGVVAGRVYFDNRMSLSIEDVLKIADEIRHGR